MKCKYRTFFFHIALYFHFISNFYSFIQNQQLLLNRFHPVLTFPLHSLSTEVSIVEKNAVSRNPAKPNITLFLAIVV